MSMTFLALSLLATAAKPASPLIINKTATAPIINADDTDAAWTSSTWQPIDIIFNGETSGFGDKGSAPADDLTARFKVTFDDNKIYVIVDVTDDNITQDPDAHWVGDKLEIYFGLPGYDEAAAANADHARQFAIKAQPDPTEKGTEGSFNYPPASDDLATNGVTYAYGETGGGYILEVSIDRAIALEAVPNNSTLGFDVCIADNDEPTVPGARFRKSWYNDGLNKELWQSMSGAGKLTLNAPASGIKELSQSVGYSIVNNLLTVNTASNVNINIYDITGKSVLVTNNSNTTSVVSLKNGIYIATIKTTDGIMLGKVRFVK